MELITAPSKISQISSQLRHIIKKNNYTEGAKLSSTRQLAQEFNVSPKTIKCALDILEEEGLIRCEHGRGVFVEAQSESGEMEVYVLLWGMRRESCNYFEEMLRITYPPVLQPGFSFTLRTVFKDSEDFTHFDQELARIENSPGIKCVLTPSANFNIEQFKKLDNLHCPVVYIGDSKYEEAADYPRNRVIDTADWTKAAINLLQDIKSDEFTIFIPDGSILFFKEYTSRLVRAASQKSMKINLVEMPCSLFNESDSEKIRQAYQRNVQYTLRNGELDCPVITYGMIDQIFMELPEIKERVKSNIPFIEPRLSGAHMGGYYEAIFELIEATVKNPADLHIKKTCTPVLLYDYATGRKRLYNNGKEIAGNK